MTRIDRSFAAALMLALVSLPLAGQAAVEGDAIKVAINGVIHTMDGERPRAEALAWNADGRLVAVGSSDELQAAYPAVEAIDLGGRAVIPGLIDAHGHVMGLGLARLNADLVGAASRAEVIARLRAHEADLPDGAWLQGRGWDQTLWEDPSFPSAADLDEAFPERPVLLERVDGHAVWTNSAAIEATGVDFSGDWQPEGGQIVRDRSGRATGVFVDRAEAPFRAVIPPPSEAELALALDRALAEMARLGLTGVHDAGTSLADVRRFLHREAAGGLTTRIHAMADGASAHLDALCRMGIVETGRVTARAVKLYADGALGSRGAALLAPYSDDPENRGLLFESDADLQSVVDRAMGCGLQVAIHAIGDRANRQVVDALIAGHARHPDNPGRHRIEHVQIIHPDDIPRLADAGIVASMQPTHATSDMRWAEQRLGAARLEGAYAWQRLRQAGAPLAFGSDFPVEPVNPFFGIHAAVTRQDREGEPPGGWLPDQRVTVEVALAGFTIEAAKAAFVEDEVGSLTVGKRADFLVLDRDPLEVPADQLHAIRVLVTALDGEPVHRTDDAPM